jgi:hypothetical protein
MKTLQITLTRNEKKLKNNLISYKYYNPLKFLVWVASFILFISLWIKPTIGLNALWNVLIPVAPALFVFAPGFWRNICPLSSTSVFLQRFKLSSPKKLSPRWQDRLTLLSLLSLLMLVPLRHILLDNNGIATTMTLASLAFIAILMGLFFEMKSGWCATLCPVHPVEKLYGTTPLFSTLNTHCKTCVQCVLFCSDSIPQVTPYTGEKRTLRKWTGTLTVGGFAGFIWGWFQVPNYTGTEGWKQLETTYGYPLLGFLISLTFYLILRQLFSEKYYFLLTRIFAALAVSCYYWYRLPALVGFGLFPGDGQLMDLRHTLPHYFPQLSHLFTTTLFFWWCLVQNHSKQSWEIRPLYRNQTRPSLHFKSS